MYLVQTLHGPLSHPKGVLRMTYYVKFNYFCSILIPQLETCIKPWFTTDYKIKSCYRNNPYIKKWGSMYYIGVPTFRYTDYFCYLTLVASVTNVIETILISKSLIFKAKINYWSIKIRFVTLYYYVIDETKDLIGEEYFGHLK